MKHMLTIGALFLVQASTNASDEVRAVRNLLYQAHHQKQAIDNTLTKLPQTIVANDTYLQKMLTKIDSNIPTVNYIHTSKIYTPESQIFLQDFVGEQEDLLKNLGCHLGSQIIKTIQ